MPPLSIRPLLIVFIVLLLLSGDAFSHGFHQFTDASIFDGGNSTFLWLGTTHMLTGYDHLLFVFGIIFFLTSFAEIVKYITAFTLGHSATLIYATFAGIQLNYFLIDAIIGLSVVYIAFANLDGFRKYLNISPPNLFVMITFLGMIHGFGLSTRLQELPLNKEHLLGNIIFFNVGIELGQVVALTVMLAVLMGWRKSKFFATFSLASNYVLIFLGVSLFMMQMYGFLQVPGVAETSTSSQ